MITAYTGLPGSGKTLHVMREALWAARRGQGIVTNVAIDWGAAGIHPRGGYAYMPTLGIDAGPDDVMGARTVRRAMASGGGEGRWLIVWDEAQIALGSRDWNAAGRREWLRWFAEHRKVGANVILVTQDLSGLDKRVRGLVEYETIHRNATHARGVLGVLAAIFPMPPIVAAVTYWAVMGRGRGARTGAEWIIGTKRLYGMYNTCARVGAPPPPGGEGEGTNPPPPGRGGVPRG